MTMQYDLNRINTLTADLEFIRQQGEDRAAPSAMP
jgi:hypothetical protein